MAKCKTVNDQMRVFKEEIFGPVAPIFSVGTEEQVIEMANNTEFDLVDGLEIKYLCMGGIDQ